MASPAVLVVDDEEDFTKLATDELIEYGFSATSASGGKEAIDLLSRKFFDVCLLDMSMPEIDGPQVLLSASEMGVETEFVVISAFRKERYEDHIPDIDDLPWLSKPVKFDVLMSLIEDIINNKNKRMCLTTGDKNEIRDLQKNISELEGQELSTEQRLKIIEAKTKILMLKYPKISSIYEKIFGGARSCENILSKRDDISVEGVIRTRQNLFKRLAKINKLIDDDLAE